MSGQARTWALVLAAGEGSRLRSLTVSSSGTIVPKQFCFLFVGPSLLVNALERARVVADTPRTCVVVAEQHRRWWQEPLQTLPAANVIVQPQNRGTANGVLLSLLHIRARDPGARIVLLPSDHHVQEEGNLAASLRGAVERLAAGRGETLLLGVEPQEVDPELGYIVPGARDEMGALAVGQFVEKSSGEQVVELIRSGGLWNTFIIAASANALIALFRAKVADVVERMDTALERDRGGAGMQAIAAPYRDLPILDFSRDILTGQESALRTVPVASCGWSDLGTPKRVAAAVRAGRVPSGSARLRVPSAQLSLAQQLALGQASTAA